MIIVHRRKKDRGLVNKLLNNLPVELHIPGYQYCGTGAKLAKRLTRGDSRINARNHKVFANKAWGGVTARDAGAGEKMSACAITNAMKLKKNSA